MTHKYILIAINLPFKSFHTKYNSGKIFQSESCVNISILKQLKDGLNLQPEHNSCLAKEQI